MVHNSPSIAERAPRRADLRRATTIKVFIAEDHRVTLWGLERLINGTAPRMEVVGSATTRAELVAHPALPLADLVLLDLDLDGESVADVMADVHRRTTGNVLILTGSDDTGRHKDLIVRGARGVLHKSEAAETVLKAIESVHAGEAWLSRDLVSAVLGSLTGRAPQAAPQSDEQRRIASLTPREREIVQSLTAQSSAKLLAIAGDLSMSENTLRNHLTTIYSKLQVRGRLELHVFATEHGLTAGDAAR